MHVINDESCRTRDGAKLAVDVYLPDDGEPCPALLAFSPYGKRFQRAVMDLPRQPHGTPLWNGAIEAGDTEYITDNGYAHVIADCRGTGESSGEFTGRYHTDGEDGYDLVEWTADQPWCDGQVGMVGRSYFGTVQLLTAAERPPSLVGIFASGVITDTYRESAYHGGIPNLFLLKWWRYVPGSRATSVERRARGEVAFENALKELLEERDLRDYPATNQLLHYPEMNLPFVDQLLNRTDGAYWDDRSPATVLDQIECPVHLSGAWKGSHSTPTYTADAGITSELKRVLLTPPVKLDRPYHEYREEMIRWYDGLTSDGPNAFEEEPPVKMYVSGVDRWRFEESLEPDRAEPYELFLRNHGRLLPDREPLAEVPPSGFVQPPLTVTNEIAVSRFRTPPLTDPMEFVGPVGLTLYAAIDAEDTPWLGRLRDVDPSGGQHLLGRGFLRASHRELDAERTSRYRPYHSHTDPTPVEPGEIYEYRIGFQPIGHRFRAGHQLELELRSMELPGPRDEEYLLESHHLPHSETIAHRLYHSDRHPSKLVLPSIPETDPSQWIEADDPAHPGPHR